MSMPANTFLKFDPEIKGESQQDKFDGQIEILSYSWSVSQSGGFGFAQGGTTAKANMGDLNLSFRMNSASPKLMQYCASGKHLDKATLTCLKAGGDDAQKYLENLLTDVL